MQIHLDNFHLDVSVALCHAANDEVHVGLSPRHGMSLVPVWCLAYDVAHVLYHVETGVVPNCSLVDVTALGCQAFESEKYIEHEHELKQITYISSPGKITSNTPFPNHDQTGIF
jgi:hypothetical protein